MQQRYTDASVQFQGQTISSPDRAILLGGLHEIFCDEVYRHSSPTDQPTIIDAGANIGLATLYFKTLFPKAIIHAFEADPKIFGFLTRNLSPIGDANIHLHHAALWSENGSIQFRLEGGASGRIPEQQGDHNETISVPTLRLRDFIRDIETVDFLKMDIEGAETTVLLDCDLELARCKKVFLEFHSFTDMPNRLDQLLNLFTQLGFRYYIKEASNNPHPFMGVCEIDGMDLQLNIYAYQ